MIAEQSANPTKIQKVIFGKKSKLFLLCSFLGLNVLVFGTFYLLKNPSTNSKFLSNVPGEIEKDGSSHGQDGANTEEATEEPMGVSDSSISANFSSLNEELDKQITYVILSRRNYLLGKAMNSVGEKGKTLQYWLLDDFNRMRENLKKELLTRSVDSISGLGGEYTGKATDSEKARAMMVDMKAVVLALQFIKDTPKEYISPEVMISRVSVGKTLDLSASLDVAIKTEIQKGLWESVEKHRMQIEADQGLATDTTTAIQELKQDGNTTKKNSK